MNIIYIPFSADENNFKLLMSAMNWRYVQKTLGFKNKMPEVITYQNASTQDEDSYPHLFSTPANNNEMTIYVLAEGFGKKKWVGNKVDKNEDPKLINVVKLAKRLKKSGFTPELAKKTKALKLYICDSAHQNLELAKNFCAALGNEYQGLPVQFYEAFISTPFLAQENPMFARFFNESHKIAFQLNDNNSSDITYGRPSAFRKTLIT